MLHFLPNGTTWRPTLYEQLSGLTSACSNFMSPKNFPGCRFHEATEDWTREALPLLLFPRHLRLFSHLPCLRLLSQRSFMSPPAHAGTRQPPPPPRLTIFLENRVELKKKILNPKPQFPPLCAELALQPLQFKINSNYSRDSGLSKQPTAPLSSADDLLHNSSPEDSATVRVFHA